MEEYVNTLIITMLVSQLAITLTPSKAAAKKYVKLVCGLVVILCLYSPILQIIKNGGEFVDKIRNMLSVPSNEEVVSNKYTESAAVIIEYVVDEYRVDRNDMKITFITDEDDAELLEVHVFLNNTDSAIADRIEYDLASQISVPIFVFVGDE